MTLQVLCRHGPRPAPPQKRRRTRAPGGAFARRVASESEEFPKIDLAMLRAERDRAESVARVGRCGRRCDGFVLGSARNLGDRWEEGEVVGVVTGGSGTRQCPGTLTVSQ